MKKKDFSGHDVDALKREISTLRREIFDLKLNASTMHLKDYSQINKLKKNVARAFTVLKQKETSLQG